jgi:hypothetical protein
MKYRFLDNKSSDKKHYGMIAQDVEKLFPEIVTEPAAGGSNHYAVNYSAYGVIAIKAIQEQQKKIETLEERIVRLEAALTKAIGKSNSNVTKNEANSAVKEASNNALEQNQPNPFNQSTVIRHPLPQGSTGQLQVYDVNGVLVKSLRVSSSQTVLNASELKAGTYTYTLIVDGAVTGSRKMVVVK